MREKIINIARMIFGAALLISIIVPTGSMADDSIIEVKREDVGSRVLAYSPMIKGMTLDRVQLASSYRDLKDQMDDLETLYDQLEGYQGLYKMYNAMSTNYQIWLAASAAAIADPSDPSLALTVAELTDGDYLSITDDQDEHYEDPADGPDSNLLTGTEELFLKGEIDSGLMMSVEAYISYTSLQAVFGSMGITNPNLSNEEEYNRFIYPIKIAPLAMQSGIYQLGVGIEQAAAGLESGAESLYDATLMLEGYLAMQKISYDMSVTALQEADKRYELGLISSADHLKAVNDETIAKLSYESLARDVDNMKMSLNVMLGQPVQTPLALVDEAGDSTVLEPLDFYISRGLKERAEILTIDYSKGNKDSEMDIYEDYLGKSSLEYIRGDYKLADLAFEKAYAVNDIEADIRKAYIDVLEKEKKYHISELKLQDSLRQKSDMQLYVELGFVTASTARGLDILVTQATGDYYGAYRDYLSAITTLELQSGIGQASAPGM